MRTEHSGSVVYFIGAYRGLIKIGVAKDVQARLRALQTGSAVRLYIMATTPGSYALERHYHARFAEYREHGEWFRRNPDMAAEIRRLKRTKAPPFESPKLVAERDRLRDEWAAAVERRNRSNSTEAA